MAEIAEDREQCIQELLRLLREAAQQTTKLYALTFHAGERVRWRSCLKDIEGAEELAKLSLLTRPQSTKKYT